MTKFEPEKKFTEICENYLSSVETLKSVDQVNNWCSQKTHGKIKKIINELNPDTQMILLNAVYFKGLWQNDFAEVDTELKSFYNLNKEEKKVETMNKLSFFNYYEDSYVQAVEIPYKNDSMSAVIILPNKELDINSWINKVSNTKNNLYSIIKKLSHKRVNLELPKFELKYEVTLNQYLKNLGMLTAFTNSADFTGLRKKGLLKIDSIIHKTYLKVDEEGTEAVATTGAVTVVHTTGFLPPKVYEMKVNRPFLFLIKSSKLPENYDLLFMAKIEHLK